MLIIVISVSILASALIVFVSAVINKNDAQALRDEVNNFFNL